MLSQKHSSLGMVWCLKEGKERTTSSLKTRLCWNPCPHCWDMPLGSRTDTQVPIGQMTTSFCFVSIWFLPHFSHQFLQIPYFVVPFKKNFTSSGIILPYFMCSVAQSCPTLCDPVDCSPLGLSVHRISQARLWEWVAISSSRASSWPKDHIQVSCVSSIGKKILYHCTTWEAHSIVTYWCLFNIFILNLFSMTLLRYIWKCV